MKAVNIRELKNNPSKSLRMAREGPVVVLNRDTPESLLVSLHGAAVTSIEDVRVVIATALFKDGVLPLARAARAAGLPLESFMEHISRQGLPVLVGDSASVNEDVESLSKWLGDTSSSLTPAR